MELNEKLKRGRKNSELTQQQVAEQLHVSRKTISGWENGRTYPDISTVVKLCDLYRVSLDDLLRDDHLLEHYAQQDQRDTLAQRLSQFSYYFGLVLLMMCYMSFFVNWGVLTQWIPTLLPIDLIIFYATFSDWARFKKKRKLILAIIVFIVILHLNFFIEFGNPSIYSKFSGQDTAYILSFSFARISLIFVMSFCVEMLLFFRRKRRNK